jgi:hypothetical protein
MWKAWTALQKAAANGGSGDVEAQVKGPDIEGIARRCAALQHAVERGEVDGSQIDFELAATKILTV